MQSRHHLVEVDVPGGDASHLTTALRELLDPQELLIHHFGERRPVRALPLLGDLEDGRLGEVEELRQILLSTEGLVSDLPSAEDQAPGGGTLANNLGVVLEVLGARHVVRQRADVRQPAHLLRSTRARDALHHGQHLCRLTLLRHPEHEREQLLMRLAVEVVGGQELGDRQDPLRVEHEPTEHGTLGFGALGKGPTFGHNGLLSLGYPRRQPGVSNRGGRPDGRPRDSIIS